MTPRKLNVFFAFFPYGGNGGISNEHPSIRNWFSTTLLKMKADPRVGDIHDADFCDTPITMTRNAAVEEAKSVGADILVMVDSDQFPDYELSIGDPVAKPFWDSSFDFLYQHYDRGPVVIGAPYCGPPPNECVYVFRWMDTQSGHPNADCRQEMYPRDFAAILGGIQECSALPTGLIMFDMRAFGLIKPPYFRYEFTDETESAKASTEDVTATRDISLSGCLSLGYNPVHCNWDAWAGHVKPKIVGKPRPIMADTVANNFAEAKQRGHKSNEQLVMVAPFVPREGDNVFSITSVTTGEEVQIDLRNWRHPAAGEAAVDPRPDNKPPQDWENWRERKSPHPDEVPLNGHQ